MKKFTSILLALLLILGTIAGCTKTETTTSPQQTDTNSNENTPALIDGDYEVEVKGHNGPMKVKVSFSNGTIADVEIIEHSETKVLSDPAIEGIPADIVKYNSINVDTVAGATITSYAIINAVRTAINEAGGNPNNFQNGISKPTPEHKTIETDIVVVGAGAAGIAAALKADELGSKVILLEKTGQIGGEIVVSGGNQVVMGSELQKQAGVTNDTVESMVNDFMKNGANLNDKKMLTLFAKNVGRATDWMNQYVGVQYDMEGGLHKLAEYQYDRELAYKNGGPGFARSALEKIQSSNIELYLNTKATELKVDEKGNVIGVLAEDKYGNTYDITAKAVVLATGGYGANKELLSEDLANALFYGRSTATGDGHIMAQKINAKFQLMDYGKRYPNGIEVSPGIAKSTIAGNIVAFNEHSAILINKEGKRVVNEKASNRTILETLVQQTDQMLYLLMDQTTFDAWKAKLGPAGISESDINSWLEKNGSTTPYFMTGKTIKELAEVSGIPEETLQNTIDTYNSYVREGEDKEFGRPKEFMNAEIGEGPYYLVEQKPRFATTMGGVVLNENMQVININDEPIPGLFAAGELANGVMGDDSPSGANNAWAITSGMLAGEAASNYAKQ